MTQSIGQAERSGPSAPQHARLQRDVGLFAAMMMGLGSIIGTGVFVSIGLAVDAAGSGVLAAILLSAVVAACNGLNSAQLAARHPVSGGTYEYGYEYLNPALGFTAGWMFLCAKTASAATAAQGFAGYLISAVNASERLLAPLAGVAVAALTLLVLTGIRQSSRANVVIVSVTLAALVAFCVAGASEVVQSTAARAGERGPQGETLKWPGVFHAAALMFVAFTGYGRIATLGEEVRDPRHTIPRAIVVTLVVSALLYMGVGAVLVSLQPAAGAARAGEAQPAPLQAAAAQLSVPGIAALVTLGAITAMLGVLLNLILGLSRVLLAMGRRGDAPRATASLNVTETTPYVAVIVVGLAITGLALTGNVRTTWSFSAFTVLIYYAITNLAALRMPKAERLYPSALAWGGLAACLFLAFWVERQVWMTGLALIVAGLMWHLVVGRSSRGGSHMEPA